MADSMNDDPHSEGELFSADDWQRLRELRASFLRSEDRVGPIGNYWNTRRDLELYDATFAQRIGWKWERVFDELALRGITLEGQVLADWGCGTGIAARRYAERVAGVKRVFLSDRNKQATWFARDALLAEHGKLETTLHEPGPDEPFDVLLVSHVLDELDEAALEALLSLARRATIVVWVEAGSRRTSRALSTARDRLLEHFDVLAPCTHRERCGALGGDEDSSWCHFFGKPPAEVFTSAFWRSFAGELSIDLRSIPYAFVVLRRRATSGTAGAGARILGRPRIFKGHAKLDVCDASGVRELTMLERLDKRLYKRLGQTGEILVADLRVEGERIVEFTPRPGA
ncbi:MAG: methyltransferase domain-containing protein [Planctomycetes bacterium]|nr:methyltransferase domain-containing protein [Planctomycetota bacterium]